MSATQHRRQLDNKRKQRVAAEKKFGDYRTTESSKRAAAAKLRQDAGISRSETTVKAKLREAGRRDDQAAAAGKSAGQWQKRATNYLKEETSLATKLARAEQAEAVAAERKRQRAAQVERKTLENRLMTVEVAAVGALRELRAPKPEPLRVLILSASPEGDLRVGREQKRIRAAVESAHHGEQIDFDHRAAATTEDLLDGTTRFRPHIVHFSGHSGDDLILFEEEKDEVHEGVVVTAHAFASAVMATDTPPLLVVLNSCRSANQASRLVAEGVVPFAVGMAEEIDDADAIVYAARFYATVANGHSIQSAHASGQAALELAGLQDAYLPTLAWATSADPKSAVLVTSAQA